MLKSIRIISIVILNAFLLLDIAWAGGTEVICPGKEQMLSAPVQINSEQFSIMFDGGYKLQERIQDDTTAADPEPERQNKKSSVTLRSIIISLFMTPGFLVLNSSFSWAGEGIQKKLNELYWQYVVDTSNGGLFDYIPYILGGLVAVVLFAIFVYGVISLSIPIVRAVVKAFRFKSFEMQIRQKTGMPNLKITKEQAAQADKMQKKYGGFSAHINKGLLFITKPEEIDKGTGLQVNYLATTMAVIFTGFENVINFYSEHATAILIGGFVFAIGAAVGSIIKRIMKNERIRRKLVQPIRVPWYMWRMGLSRENTMDFLAIGMVERSDTRKEVIAALDRSIQREQADLDQQEDEPLQFAESIESKRVIIDYLKEVRYGPISRMGTDSRIFRVLYKVCSRLFRAPYYRFKLGFRPGRDYFEEQFLYHVKRGLTLDRILDDYLKDQLASPGDSYRAGAKRILNKLVKKGFISEEELINVYMQVLETGVSDATADIILGLEDYIGAVGDKDKTKLILKLQAVIKNLEKKSRKPFFGAKNGNPHAQRKYEHAREELSKVQVLLIHAAVSVLAGSDPRDDLENLIEAAVSVKGCFKLFSKDLSQEFGGYLKEILARLEEEKKQLQPEDVPKPLFARLRAQLPKNGSGKEPELKTIQLRNLNRHIKTVKSLIARLDQVRTRQTEAEEKEARKAQNNNLGLVLTGICGVIDAALWVKNLRNKRPDPMGQAI